MFVSGSSETVSGRSPLVGPYRRHGHPGPGPEEGHPEGGGVRAPHVFTSAAQRPEPGNRVHAL